MIEKMLHPYGISWVINPIFSTDMPCLTALDLSFIKDPGEKKAMYNAWNKSVSNNKENFTEYPNPIGDPFSTDMPCLTALDLSFIKDPGEKNATSNAWNLSIIKNPGNQRLCKSP